MQTAIPSPATARRLSQLSRPLASSLIRPLVDVQFSWSGSHRYLVIESRYGSSTACSSGCSASASAGRFQQPGSLVMTAFDSFIREECDRYLVNTSGGPWLSCRTGDVPIQPRRSTPTWPPSHHLHVSIRLEDWRAGLEALLVQATKLLKDRLLLGLHAAPRCRRRGRSTPREMLSRRFTQQSRQSTESRRDQRLRLGRRPRSSPGTHASRLSK
jgi:hypothetical protein